LESFFFVFGAIAIIHSLSDLYRIIICYIGKRVNPKTEFHTDWAVVTGASNGIGRLFAIDLAKKGISVIGTGRDIDRLSKVEQEVKAEGVEFIPVQVDFDEENSVDKLVDAFGDRDIGIFFINAGYGIFGDFMDYSLEKLQRFTNTMVVNQALTIRAILERNKERKEKTQILVTASLAAFAVWPNGQMYCAVKSFQSSFARHVALEAGDYTNIKVQAVHPSFFGDSGFFDKQQPYLKGMYASLPIQQSSSEVAQSSLQALGKSIWCDPSIYGAGTKLIYWFIGDILGAVIGRILIKIHRKLERKSKKKIHELN
jgi:short-subunit dehydrogenase